MFKLLPERKSSFVNKMSFFLEPCTISIHFPPLMHTGSFYVSACFIFLSSFFFNLLVFFDRYFLFLLIRSLRDTRCFYKFFPSHFFLSHNVPVEYDHS